MKSDHTWRHFAIFLVTAAAVGLSGCSPKPEKREYKRAKQDFGASLKDTDLSLGNEPRAQSAQQAFVWQAETDSSVVLGAAETLMRLGRLSGRAGVVDLGLSLADTFYSSPGVTTKARFDSSPFVSAAVGETQASTVAIINEALQMLKENTALIDRVLDSSRTEFPWPQTSVSLEESLHTAGLYISFFIRRLEALGIDALVLDGIRGGIREEFEPLLTEAQARLPQLRTRHTLEHLVLFLKESLQTLDVELEADVQKELDEAYRLGGLVNTMQTPQEALTVLVEFWQRMDPAERELNFKPVSEDLYDYLSGRDNSDLNCLKTPNCGLFTQIAKQLKIFPAIADYGILKLRDRLNQGALEFALVEISIRVARSLPDLADIFKERITREIGVQSGKLQKIRESYPQFIKGLAKDWSESTLEQRGIIRGVEIGRVHINVKSNGGIKIGSAKTNGKFVTGADVLGASLSLAAARWDEVFERDPKSAEGGAFMQNVIEQINKLLVIGGFRMPDKKSYPAYARPVERSAPLNTYLDLRNVLSTPYTFAVSDRVAVADVYIAYRIQPESQVSVRGQAELLRGLSGMIRHFRDYEMGAFDVGVGAVELRHILKDLPEEALAQRLFPKDMMFAMSVGNAAAILQNMVKEMSNVFLLNLEGQTIWADDFDFSQGNSATAGMVDISNGERGNLSHSADVARFVLALAEFLRSVEGIEKTTAAPLLEKDADGERPVDILVEAKGQLRHLIVGLANFLSHKMQAKEGGVASVYSLTDAQVVAGPRNLGDQVLAIRALLAASETLSIDVYRWAALDIYYFLNARMWDPDALFYRSVEGESTPVAPDVRLMMLEAGQALRAHMPSGSQTQWDRIASPWFAALETF